MTRGPPLKTKKTSSPQWAQVILARSPGELSWPISPLSMLHFMGEGAVRTREFVLISNLFSRASAPRSQAVCVGVALARDPFQADRRKLAEEFPRAPVQGRQQ